MTANVQELIDDAHGLASGSMHAPLLISLANALDTEAQDRVNTEEALRRYGGEPTPETSEPYDDTLEIKANIDTIGIIRLTLPIRLADETGAPDIVRAFNLARDIVDSALMLAAEDEAGDEAHLADVIPMACRFSSRGAS